MPGKFLYTAEVLPRAPSDLPLSNKEEVECYVNAFIVSLPTSDHRLEEIRSELKRDDSLKIVMQHMYTVAGRKTREHCTGQMSNSGEKEETS